MKTLAAGFGFSTLASAGKSVADYEDPRLKSVSGSAQVVAEKLSATQKLLSGFSGLDYSKEEARDDGTHDDMHHAAEMELKRMPQEQRATVEREFGRRIDVANRMLAVIETEAKQLSTAAEKEVSLRPTPISRAVLNLETLREQEAVNESFRSSFSSIGAAKRVAKNWKAKQHSP